MSAVESIVKLLLQKLGDRFVQEALFLCGVRDQVGWLEAEFKRMRCFLKDADAKQEGDERVKNWVQDVRDVAYDAEDVIDTFVFKIAALRREGSVGCIRRYLFFFMELIALYKVGLEIKGIKNKILSVSESRPTYGIEGTGTSSSDLNQREWRHTSPLEQEPDFVGFEKDLKELVARLMKGEQRRCVVSVVGMGGLGKTTLTKKVYNSTQVQTYFDPCEWISMSQEYDVKDLLRNIIKQYKWLPEEDLKNMNVFQLRHEISERLKKKRYLIVLDDIWTMKAWDDLNHAFPDMQNGSRVMLTTRNKDVALHADAQSRPYELRILEKDNSWELFCKKTFPGQKGSCPQEFEELGREIVEKCYGLPLAIVVIGGLLSRKEPWEWENVLKSISQQFVKQQPLISRILSLSYRDLPYDLKPCFLYLGNFPEDCEFRAKELIQLWAAEGLLQQRGVLTLEEDGEDCLKELTQRSLVQVARRSSNGGIKSCRIHDLLRDLSISEAMEGKFLQVHHWKTVRPPASRARRLAIHHNARSKYISLSCSSQHLRSVLIYTQGNALLEREEEKFLYRGFKLLRVLYLEGAPIEKLPNEIGELIHLRYLGCCRSLLKSLPSSIGNLPNLQTLNVTSSHDIDVPSTIEKMQELRHLQVKHSFKKDHLGYIGWGVIEGYPRLDWLSNLQTLSLVKAGEWMKGCLGKLTNLRKLGIGLVTRADAEVLYESIATLDSLHSLSVVTLGYEDKTPVLLLPLSRRLKLSKLRLEGKLEKLPFYFQFPRNLIKLTLALSHLKKDPLATLEMLENLRVLRLLLSSYKGKEMACAAGGFPHLESLHLEELHHLEEWRVEKGAMPSLLHLRISYCPRLKKLPEGLQHVTTLKTLELWNIHPSFNTHMIHSIPSISIDYME